MWNPTTFEQLRVMMDGHLPPLEIPPSREGKDALTDNEVLTIVGYWKVFNSRLRENFEDSEKWRLLAGWLAEPWGEQNWRCGDFHNWLDYSGTGERLGLVKTSRG
jgi:hypothetical protein